MQWCQKGIYLLCPIQSQLIPPTPSLPKALVCGYLLHSLRSSVIPLIDCPSSKEPMPATLLSHKAIG